MKHKIITFGELMLRLSPDNNERFTQAQPNIAVNMAY
jgi:2-dehydro-3-deoxygluconokinase